MGLRERKKVKTAQAIEDAAVRLFDERGFHATTIADIAEAAEIAPRTFFSYFPSKESVLFGDFDDTFRSLADHLDARGDATVLTTIRAWIVDLVESDGLPDERKHARLCVVNATPELLTFERQLTLRFEGLLAAAIATELDAEPTDLHPRLVAAAIAASFGALRPEPDAPEPAAEDRLASVDDALAFLEGGISALRRRRRRRRNG
jgi:AcrR family transcriptional regulator